MNFDNTHDSYQLTHEPCSQNVPTSCLVYPPIANVICLPYVCKWDSIMITRHVIVENLWHKDSDDCC
jgi:hypothetical protein